MKELDLEKKVKPMPYRVPEGFFESFPDRMMQRVALENTRRRIRRIWFTTGAAAAMIVGLLFVGLSYQSLWDGRSGYQGLATIDGMSVMDRYVSTLSDEELAEQLQLFESDVTLVLHDYE